MDKLPTLESILAEPECGSLSGTDDDITSLSTEKLGGSGETASVGSLLSLTSLNKSKTTQPPPSGAILRHIILKGICAQITSVHVSYKFAFKTYFIFLFVLILFLYLKIYFPILGKNQRWFGQCSGWCRKHASHRYESWSNNGIQLFPNSEMVRSRSQIPRSSVSFVFQPRCNQNPRWLCQRTHSYD